MLNATASSLSTFNLDPASPRHLPHADDEISNLPFEYQSGVYGSRLVPFKQVIRFRCADLPPARPSRIARVLSSR